VFTLCFRYIMLRYVTLRYVPLRYITCHHDHDHHHHRHTAADSIVVVDPPPVHHHHVVGRPLDHPVDPLDYYHVAVPPPFPAEVATSLSVDDDE